MVRRGLLIFLLLASVGAWAEEPMRGIVVDRSGDMLWIGLPAPAASGMMFNIMLMPGSTVLAEAEVISATPDAPYLAKARMRLSDPDASVPVGAYAEAVGRVEPQETMTMGALEGWDNETKDASQQLSLDVGALYPMDSDLRRETSSLWPAFRVSYRTTRFDSPMRVEIALGYTFGDGDFSEDIAPGVSAEGHREMRVMPLTVDAKMPLSRSKPNSWYWRAGVGAYFVSDERTVGDTVDKRDVTTVGWQGGIGYESRSGQRVDLYYADVASTDFRGLTLSVGTRF